MQVLQEMQPVGFLSHTHNGYTHLVPIKSMRCMFRGILPFHIISHNTNMEAVINMTKVNFTTHIHTSLHVAIVSVPYFAWFWK